MSAHTPGPWRWEYNAKHKSVHLVGGRPMYDLTVMDFVRCGMGGATIRLRDPAHDGLQLMHKLHDFDEWIAPFPGREHHADWCAAVTHPDARLIAAAPELYAACEAAIAYDDAIAACGNDPRQMSSFCTAQGDTLDSLYEDWIRKSTAALARARGES